MLPMASAMCMNGIVQYSLAQGSTPFIEICSKLRSPVIAALSLVMYRMALPRTAAFTLVPLCVGVFLADYYDMRSRRQDRKAFYRLDLTFAFSGIVLSSLYTAWIGIYHARFDMNRIQQCSSRIPLLGAILLYLYPRTCSFIILSEITLERWTLLLQVGSLGATLLQNKLIVKKSAACAYIMNTSQLILIAEARTVSSKTAYNIARVAMGNTLGCLLRPLPNMGIVGSSLAISIYVL